MKKLSALLLLAVIATPALAVDRYKIEASLSQNGEVIKSFTDVVDAGVTSHFEQLQHFTLATTIYEIEAESSDEPAPVTTSEETSPITTGVVIKATPKTFKGDKTQLEYELKFTEIEGKAETDGSGKLVEVPVVRHRSIANSVLVQHNESPTVLHFGAGNDLSLSISATKL